MTWAERERASRSTSHANAISPCLRRAAADADDADDRRARGPAGAVRGRWVPGAALLLAPGASRRSPTTRTRLFGEMDFGFLFDPVRKLFSIGYRIRDGSLDPSYYDLLASEARLTSFVAIAKGDVAPDHWFRLGRVLTPVGRGSVAGLVVRVDVRVPDARAW